MTINLSQHAGGGITPYFKSELGAALLAKCIFYNNGENTNDMLGGISPGVSAGIAFAPGVTGNALSLNGTNSQINYGTAPSLDMDGTEKRSWSFWCIRKNNDNECIMSRGANNLHTGIGWTLMTAGGTTYYLQLNGTSGYPTDELQVNCTVPAQNGAILEHVVITYSGNKLASGVKFYVNKVLKGTITGANNLTSNISNPTAEFILGGSTEALLTSDLLDEVCIFDDELSQEEVNFLYANGLASTIGEFSGLGLPTIGDATAADIITDKVAWVDGVRLVGSNPGGAGKIILFHEFNGTVGTPISGTSPDFCVEPIVFSSDGISLDGSGFCGNAGAGSYFLHGTIAQSRIGKIRRYRYWGKYTGSVASTYMPQVRLNWNASGVNFWTFRLSGGVSLQSYKSDGSNYLATSSRGTSGVCNWILDISDYGDFMHCSFTQEPASRNTTVISSNVDSVNSYELNRAWQNESRAMMVWEGTDKTKMWIRGMMIWDE